MFVCKLYQNEAHCGKEKINVRVEKITCIKWCKEIRAADNKLMCKYS